jgi:hypothetical protein
MLLDISGAKGLYRIFAGVTKPTDNGVRLLRPVHAFLDDSQ